MSAFDRILVPLDGSPLADRILQVVARVLKRKDAEVLLVRVIPDALVEGASWVPERVTEDIQNHVDRVREGLAEQGVRAFSRVVTGDPAAAILEEAAGFKATVIAMATHGRSGVGRWLLGSTAERVLRESPVPVLLANRDTLEAAGTDGETRFARVLVPLDGSDAGARILPLASEFAGLYDSEVVLLHVQTPVYSAPDPYFVATTPPPSATEGQAVLAPHASRLEAEGRTVRTVVEVDLPANRILSLAKDEPADLIAMTTHGYSGLSRWAFGSVAEKVLRHSPCPLLILRAPDEPAGES